ncbi:MAG: hypothetical protein ACNA8W_00645 [Bradymonadaceae bacterium]
MNTSLTKSHPLRASTTYLSMAALLLMSFILGGSECSESSASNTPVSSYTQINGSSSSVERSTQSDSAPQTDDPRGAQVGVDEHRDPSTTPESSHTDSHTPQTDTPDTPGSSHADTEDMDESGQCRNDAQCGANKDCVQGVCVFTGPLRFTLVWHEGTDLDIHVVTPSGAKLWYRNRNIADGGRFETDACIGSACATAEGPLIESVFWGEEPTHGTYQFWVVNYSGTQSVPFTFDVNHDGERSTHSGTVQASRNAESQRFTLTYGDGTEPANFTTVADVIPTSCSTTSVMGLSQQLIDELNCVQPGAMKSFAGAPGIQIRSAVLPFMQTPATNALITTTSGGGSMTISSALRTIPQQLLLYRWYRTGRCNIRLAASPGRSNHNGGLSIDTPDYSNWRQRLTNRGFRWFGSRDAVHYDYRGGGTSDIRSNSVLAFQRLWNRNNPDDRIAEDGSYGPDTERRVKESPAAGFRQGASCGSPNSLTSWFYPNVEWWIDAGDWMRVSTILPADIGYVEYLVNGEIVQTATREDGPNFDTAFGLSKEAVNTITIRGYDHEGRLAASATGWVAVESDALISVRPRGADIYEFSLDRTADKVKETAVLFNDEPVVDDRRRVEREMDLSVFSHVPIDLKTKSYERSLSIGLFDHDDRLMRTIEFELP